MTRATFVVHWPSAQEAQDAKRRRESISVSTASITVAVNGGTPQVVNKPTLSGSPSTTKVSIVAPPGEDSFTFIAWDEAGGAGNELDEVTQSQNIIANANNSISVALDAVCAALVPSLAATTIYEETTKTTIPLASGSRTVLESARLIGNYSQSFTFTPVDADGNTILTTAGSIPISVKESGTVPHVTIAAAASGTANTTFNLTPLTAEPDGFSTSITASSPNCGPGTATLPNSFALSTSAEVFVADYDLGIFAYDQDGKELAQVATTGTYALAYNSKSNYLVSTQGYGSPVPFTTLSLSGKSLGSGSITPMGVYATTSDGFGVTNIAYDPVDGYVYIALQEGFDSNHNAVDGSVAGFAISGSTATAETPNFPGLVDPFNLAITPNGDVLVEDAANSDGTYLFDQNGQLLGATYPAVSVDPLVVDSSRGKVVGLSGADAATGVILDLGDYLDTDANFKALPGTTLMAYNPGEDEFYFFGNTHSASGLSGTTIYSGGSTASNLPAGAFSAVANPSAAVVVP